MPFPNGAGIRNERQAALLVDHATERTAGGVLVWAAHHGVTPLQVILQSDPAVGGLLARRFAATSTEVTVCSVRDGELVEIDADGFPPEHPTAEQHWRAVSDLRDATADIADLDWVAEWGSVRAELNGLEIGRTVDGDVVRFEPGIGRFDREASALMNADKPLADTLRDAAQLVARHRVAGGPPHPLHQLSRERWLRAHLMRHPEILGVGPLQPLDMTLDVPNMRDPFPAASFDGETIVVTTVGADVDAVSLAADTRRWHSPDSRLMIALPARDVTRSVSAVAESVIGRTDLITVTPPWEPAAH